MHPIGGEIQHVPGGKHAFVQLARSLCVYCQPVLGCINFFVWMVNTITKCIYPCSALLLPVAIDIRIPTSIVILSNQRVKFIDPAGNRHVNVVAKRATNLSLSSNIYCIDRYHRQIM